MSLSLSLSPVSGGRRLRAAGDGIEQRQSIVKISLSEKDGHRAASINSEDFSRTHKHSAALTHISSVSLFRFSSGSIGSTSQEIDSLSSQDRSIDFTLSSHRSSLSAKRPIDLRKNQSALQLTVASAKSFKFILSYQNKSLASTDNSQMALSRVRTFSSTLLAKVLHPTTRSFSTSTNAYDSLTHTTPSRKTTMMMNQMFTADLSSQIGSCMPISMMRIGTLIHNIEMNPGQGGKLVRAAGTSAKILKEPKASRHCLIKLPSGKEKLIDSRCRATIGTVSNPEHGAKKLRKAGQSRWLGRRPVVRGVAMNPVDHPHGGGEGRSKSSGSHGRSSRTPWGKPCKSGFKTGPLKKRR